MDIQELKLMTVKETAELLKVSPATVRNYIKRGELKAIKTGQREYRINEEALKDFLKR